MKMKEPKDEIRSRRWPKVNVLLVAAALLVPFTLFMWRIFGTKETPQQEGAAGINFSVPEGREQQIESSKQKVVAKVRTEALQAQRLLTLGEESFSLLDDRTEQPPSRQNPMQEADEANRALQRQLAQTYAPRTSERESSICGVRSRNSPHGSMRRRRQLPQIRWSWPSDNINWLRSTSAAEHRTSTPYRPNGDGSACCAPCRNGH